MKLEKFIKENKSAFDDQKIEASFDDKFAEALKKELHQKPKKSKLVYLNILAVAACFAISFTVLFSQFDFATDV